tara:strand:+ start:999 stop:1553 length:555 start_codon:yes stop_codon:yes gene_type:complete
MASYTVNGDDGTTRISNQGGLSNIFHHFEFKGHTPPTTGTVTIKKRAPGAPVDKLLDVGVYDFASPTELNFTGVVSEWVLTVDSVDTDLIYMTVTSLQVGKTSGTGIDPADQAKLDAITSTGSGSIITTVERSKINAITDTGSGQVITEAERTKLENLSNTPILDILLEGIAFGKIYAKNVQVG